MSEANCSQYIAFTYRKIRKPCLLLQDTVDIIAVFCSFERTQMRPMIRKEHFQKQNFKKSLMAKALEELNSLPSTLVGSCRETLP